MKTAIVTGSSGLVGSEAVEFLIEKGFRVIGIDNDMRNYFFNTSTKKIRDKLIKYENYIHYNWDIRSDSINDIFIKYSDKIELIIHAAAQPSHDWASKEPLTDFSINATGTLNLLEATRKYCPNAVFIYCSTNKVYGDTPNGIDILKEYEKRYEFKYSNNGQYILGICEDMSIDHSLHSIFGVSKTAADLMTQEYGKYFGIKTVIFRCGCITGENHAGAELHGFLSYLVKCIKEDKHYTIYGNGKNVRDNIHAYDLVSMFWEYYQNPKECGIVYNAGGGRGNDISILEAIDKINEKLHKNWNDYSFNKPRIGDHLWYITDYGKFQKDYPNWKITYNLDTIIKKMIEYEKC